MGQRHNAEERIAVDDDDVCQLPRLDRTNIAVTDDRRIDARGCRNGATWRHAEVDVYFDLAPKRLAMEVHRRTGIGTHSHHRAGLNELLHTAIAEQHFPIGALEISESPPVLQGILNLCIDVRTESCF